MRRAIEHAEALAVIVRTTDDRYRRRVYLTLSAAERAADRARAAGHEATIVLVQLQPVAEVEAAA